MGRADWRLDLNACGKWAAVLAAVSFLGLLGSPVANAASCVHPQGNLSMDPWGDVNMSGAVNAADALCTLLVSLAEIVNPADPSYPPCLTAASPIADVTCDASVSVADAVVVVQLAIGLPLAVELDGDVDGCPDTCVGCAPPGQHSCLIEGNCVPGGTAESANSCLMCLAADDSDWTMLNEGDPCGGGQVCAGGSCVATVPGAPVLTGLTPGDGELTAAFDPPAADGGSPVTSYRVTCSDGSASVEVTGVSGPLVLTGLANGVTYTCEVSATNALGEGPLSNSLDAAPLVTGGCGAECTGDATFAFTGTIETFVVPSGVFEISIYAEGASGGNSNNNGHIGGFAGFASGDFAVTPGDTLSILVGQQGENWGGIGNWHAGTGGGASYVALGETPASSTPLLVAGGGGGASQNGSGENAGLVVTASGSGTRGTDSPGTSWTGASGGAGFHENGHHHGDHPTCVMGQPLKAQSFVNGGAGGYISNFGCGLPDDVRGGFGGGGCSGSSSGGGGGGYIGGNVNGLGINNAGRAGTNYNDGMNAMNGTVSGPGNGVVTITWDATPPVLVVDESTLAVAPITDGSPAGACTALAVTNASSNAVTGLALASFSGSGLANFSTCTASSSPCGSTLAPGTTCNFGVQLVAAINGAYSATANIVAGGGHLAARDLTSTASGFVVSGCTTNCSDSQMFGYTGTIETWVVPAGVTSATIHVEGASGGDSNNNGHVGGLGAFATGTFPLTPGSTLQLLVGGVGENWGGIGNWHAGTGGGGSFVAVGTNVATSAAMIVAGGGGGASQNGSGENAGLVVTTSGPGTRGSDSPGTSWTGASGGAGFNENGHHHGDHPTCVMGQPLKAQAFVNGGAGGYISNFGCGLPDDVRGGFGGGGCSGSGSGGGGGGYVGGNVNGLGVNNAGRAGTNYNAGSSAMNGTLGSAGDGSITISWNLQPAPLTADSTTLIVGPIADGLAPGACTSLAIANTTASPITNVALGAFTGVGPENFEACTAASNACGATLAAGATCQFGVRLIATGNGTFSAIANVTADGGLTATRAVQGTATGFVGDCGTMCTGNEVYNYSGVVETFVVPAGISMLTIHAEGGSGGNSNVNGHVGGLAGYATGDFAVTPGDTLHILVGEAGENWGGIGGWQAGSGGGASFVGMGAALSSATPLLVAGGGGGASQQSSGEAAGTVVTSSGLGTGGTDASGDGWSGASGGAGYHNNGHHNGDHPTCVMGQPLKAQSFLNGGAGGYISNFGCGLPDDVRGGFGGGGASGSSNGGGGGGYIGGNVNSLGTNGAGRAGTNYNTGTSTTNGTVSSPGNGVVTISW